MSADRRGEECNALKEMPISLWMLHLIKNTAGDTGIQERESKKRGMNKKGECETESKGETLMLYEKKLSESKKKLFFSPGRKEEQY